MFLFEGETESSRNETVRGTDRKVRQGHVEIEVLQRVCHVGDVADQGGEVFSIWWRAAATATVGGREGEEGLEALMRVSSANAVSIWMALAIGDVTDRACGIIPGSCAWVVEVFTSPPIDKEEVLESFRFVLSSRRAIS
ncbi:hypothetical protein VTN49DRAFT_3481 [Thermomyces lanuginosus]|uniref:uncharacterized protein n=1 Tax=Thermomyces lanuginosus TaxID=5541 RepID=UPI0037442A8E